METKEDNNVVITKAFNIMHPMLAAFVAQSLEKVYGQSGWWSVVLESLSRSNYSLPATGEYAELVDSLDFAACLKIIDIKWADVFKQKFNIRLIMFILLLSVLFCANILQSFYKTVC